MGILEFIAKQFTDWLANPLPSFLAFGIGAYLGILISRMRHQGKIDTLEERLRHKTDQIEVKEQAIQKLSDDASALKSQMMAPAPSTEKPRAQMTLAERFQSLNEDFIKDTEAQILAAVSKTRYKFVFNPRSEQSKFLTFLDDGSIGEGRNGNEHRWCVKSGQLEIMNSKNEVYSRFNLLEDGLAFHHTNEPGLLSLKGQYMVPVSVTSA